MAILATPRKVEVEGEASDVAHGDGQGFARGSRRSIGSRGNGISWGSRSRHCRSFLEDVISVPVGQDRGEEIESATSNRHAQTGSQRFVDATSKSQSPEE
jgi:hypothetical protein